MLFWIWLTAVLAALTLYLRQVYSRFSRWGVKTQRPLPLLGNMAPVVFRQQHLADHLLKAYNDYPNERFFGRYEFLNPVVVIRDLDLIKKITVKDFEYFLDHRAIINEDTDPFFSRNLFSLKGDEWKDMRSTLSPAFTSSKIRVMVPFMVEVGDQMISSLKKQIKESATGFIDVDCKDMTTRYANDVIASCAFGLKVDSQSEHNNQFYLMGKKASQFSFWQSVLIFMQASFPWIIRKLNLSLFSEQTKQFFKRLVLDTMEDRETRHIIRPDMIHLLMEAKKGKLIHEDKTDDVDAGFATVEESAVGKKHLFRSWSDVDFTAQALLFFIAGFEGISAAMSFLLHELAVNPEVQDRLAREVRETDAKNGGKFDFNTVQQMTYMDMVVSEMLRLWTPGINLDRLCNRDYNLGKPNDKATEDYVIRKGEGLFIPVWAIHHDPQYFPDPYKFDPDRFSDENKHKIKPFSYLPFGLGPRNCIGSRFALCEVKVIAYQILRHMEISPGPKTPNYAELDQATFNVRMKGGHWVRFRARE